MNVTESTRRANAERTSRYTVSAEGIADCPFSLALSEADQLFPPMQTSAGRISVPYRTFGLPISGAMRRRVNARYWRRHDATEPGRSHDEIVLEWNARSRWLPNFHGVLRFRIEQVRTRVILQGGYVPPFGTFGAFFDLVIGRRLALATVVDLVNRIARLLEIRWTAMKADAGKQL